METASSHPPAAEPAPAAEAGTPAARPEISERRPRDLAISLLVLLVPIALMIGVYRILFDGDAPVLVDPAPAVAQARADAAFPVSVPDGLGGDWRTVSASYQRGDGAAALRIGYLTPGDGGIQLIESDVPADVLLPRELTPQASAQGVVEIAGAQWRRYSARPGERALVLLEPERTTIVVGAASDDELRELAAALPR